MMCSYENEQDRTKRVSWGYHPSPCLHPIGEPLLDFITQPRDAIGADANPAWEVASRFETPEVIGAEWD
jgi:hypothetical protein